jgi:hypothetical protein
MKNKVLLIASAAFAAVSLHAQLVFDITDSNRWLGERPDEKPFFSEGSILFNGTGNDLWYFAVEGGPTDFSAFESAALSATGFNLGNSSYTSIVFRDPQFEIVKQFILPFSSTPTTLLVSGTGSFTNGLVKYITFGADAGATSTLNWTLSNLAFVPEPSQVALGLGVVALVGAAIYRRRKV